MYSKGATIENATIQSAVINDATIKNLNGGTTVNITDNFSITSSGSCTAKDITATGTGSIGPYSIGSTALSGNGVSLEKDCIIINGVKIAGWSSGISIYGDTIVKGNLAVTGSYVSISSNGYAE